MYDFGMTNSSTSPQVAEVKAVVNAASPTHHQTTTATNEHTPVRKRKRESVCVLTWNAIFFHIR